MANKDTAVNSTTALATGIGFAAGVATALIFGGRKDAKAADASDTNNVPPGTKPPIVMHGKKLLMIAGSKIPNDTPGSPTADSFGAKVIVAFATLFSEAAGDAELENLVTLANSADKGTLLNEPLPPEYGGIALIYDILTAEDIEYVAIITEAASKATGGEVPVIWVARGSIQATETGVLKSKVSNAYVFATPPGPLNALLLDFPQDPIGIEAMTLAVTMYQNLYLDGFAPRQANGPMFPGGGFLSWMRTPNPAQ